MWFSNLFELMLSLPKLASLTSSIQGGNSCFLMKSSLEERIIFGELHQQPYVQTLSRSPKEGASSVVVMVTITVITNAMTIGMAILLDAHYSCYYVKLLNALSHLILIITFVMG